MWARSGLAFVATISTLTVGACGRGGGEHTKSAEDLPSPEREIRQTIDNYYRSQEGDLALYKSALCTAKADETKDLTDRDFARQQREAVDKNGRFIVDWFDEVKVSNGTADVAFTGHSIGGIGPDIGDRHMTAKVLLSDGSWKVCEGPEPDVVTKRKIEQLADKSAVQDVVVAYAKAIGAEDEPAVQGMTANGCGKYYDVFQATTGKYLGGGTITSIQEITVNQDVSKSKFRMDTPEVSVPLGVSLNREGGVWKVCVIDRIGQVTLKR
jgi:hypothetical protein